MTISRTRLAWIVVLPALAAASACVSTTDVSIGTDCNDGFCDDPPAFTPPPDSGSDTEASSPEAPRILACIGTECPAPWATCAPTKPCATNLQNDSENCGACGVSCGELEGLHLAGACVKGACVFQCTMTGDSATVFRDCNAFLDDGCEVNIQSDPENCGVCGHACAAGQHCIDGFCGCFPPKVDCGGKCVDTRSDDSNCKTCGTVCQNPPVVCSPMPAHTKYGCSGSECGQLVCAYRFGDCNADLADGCASNGCETALDTVENCGGCGVKCGPQQECKVQNSRLECVDTCAKAGLTKCGDQCRDLLTDILNCGACGHGCLGTREHEAPVCKKGLCENECLAGFADCNGDATDGCEVDLTTNPANCGVCGQTCDLGAGQPCIEGKCLMVECDGGVVAK